MRALRLVQDNHTDLTPAHAPRRRRTPSLALVRAPLVAPPTPTFDALAAAEASRPVPAKVEHMWHSERLLNVNSMRKELVTWCLRCDARPDPWAEETEAMECSGEDDPRVMAPWLPQNSSSTAAPP
jgi:hypothetical protein